MHKRALIGLLIILAITLGLTVLFTSNGQFYESNPPTHGENNAQTSSKNHSSQKIDLQSNQSMTIAKEQMQQLMVLPEKLSREDLRYHLYKENGWLFFFSDDYSDVRYVDMRKGAISIIGTNGKFEHDYGSDFTVSDAVFSPKLDQFAYVVYSSNPENRFIRDKSSIYLNGEKLDQEYAVVFNPTFSPDGKRFGYIAKKIDGSLVGVVDGKETFLTDQSPKELDPSNLRITFSANNKRVAYCCVNNTGGQNFFVLNDQKVSSFSSIVYFTFSPDSNRYAYVESRGQVLASVMTMITDGKRDQSSYQYVGRPVFSPDSQHIAYWAQNGIREDERKEYIILDGNEIITHPRIADIVFTPKGKIAYRYCDGTWERGKSGCFIVVGNEESGPINSLDDIKIIDPKEHPVYTTYKEESGESETLTYYSLNHKGKTSKIYDSIFGIMTLSDYNDALIFAATEHIDKYVSGKNFIIVDNNESANRFDRVWPPQAVGDNVVAYAALSGTTLYQVLTTIGPKQF